MDRKGQISVFVVIGVVLVLLAGAAILYINKNKTGEIEKKAGTVEFSADYGSVKSLYDACMESVLLEGMDKMYTLKGASPALEAYVSSNFEGCLNLPGLKTVWQEVTFENFVPKVTISDEEIMLTVTNSFVLVKDNNRVDLKENSFTLPLTTKADLTTDSNGIVKKEVELFSPDRKVKLTIPEGVKALDANGQPIKKITLKMVPRPVDEVVPAKESLMLGPVMYRMEPDGASFSPAIEMKLFYGELPAYYDETKFLLGYYNYFSGGQFVAYKSTNDDVNNVITSEITHFSDPVPLSGCGSYQEYTINYVFEPNCQFVDDYYCQNWKKDPSDKLYYDIEGYRENILKLDASVPNGFSTSYKGKCKLIEPEYAESSPGAGDAYSDMPEKDLDVLLTEKGITPAEGYTVPYHPELCSEDKCKELANNLDKVCGLLCTDESLLECMQYYIKDDDKDTAHIWRWSTDGIYADDQPTWEDYLTVKNADNEPGIPEEYADLTAKDVFSGDGVDDSFAEIIADESAWVADKKKYDCSGMKPAKPKVAWGYDKKEDIGGKAEFTFFFSEHSCLNPDQAWTNHITIRNLQEGMIIKTFKLNGKSYPVPKPGEENAYFKYATTDDGDQIPELMFKVRENKFCQGISCSNEIYVIEGENKVELEVAIDSLEQEKLDSSVNRCFSITGKVGLSGEGFETEPCTIALRKQYLTDYKTKCGKDLDATEREKTSTLSGDEKLQVFMNTPEAKAIYSNLGLTLTSDKIFTCPTGDAIVCDMSPGCYDSGGNPAPADTTLEPWFGEQCTPTSPTDMTAYQGGFTCNQVLGYEYEGDTNMCTPTCQLDTTSCTLKKDETGKYSFVGGTGNSCSGGKPNGLLDNGEQCDPLPDPSSKEYMPNGKCSDINPSRYKVLYESDGETEKGVLQARFHCTQGCTWDLAQCEYLAIGDAGKCTKNAPDDEIVDANEFCAKDSNWRDVFTDGESCTYYKGMPDTSPYSGGTLKCKSDCTYDFTGCIKKEAVRCRTIGSEPWLTDSDGDEWTDDPYLNGEICTDLKCTCECKNSNDVIVDITPYVSQCSALCGTRYGGKFVYNGDFVRELPPQRCGIGSCKDTDGGEYPLVKGKVTNYDAEGRIKSDGATPPTYETAEDKCEDSNTVNEYSCSGETYTFNTRSCNMDYNNDDREEVGICYQGVCRISYVEGKCKPEGTPKTFYRTFTDPSDGNTFEACCEAADQATADALCLGRDNKCYTSGFMSSRKDKICNSGQWDVCISDETPSTVKENTLTGKTLYCDENTKTWVESKVPSKPVYLCGGADEFLVTASGIYGGDNPLFLCYQGTYYRADQYTNVANGKYTRSTDGAFYWVAN